jgi:hypothetical protein
VLGCDSKRAKARTHRQRRWRQFSEEIRIYLRNGEEGSVRLRGNDNDVPRILVSMGHNERDIGAGWEPFMRHIGR